MKWRVGFATSWPKELLPINECKYYIEMMVVQFKQEQRFGSPKQSVMQEGVMINVEVGTLSNLFPLFLRAGAVHMKRACDGYC